MLERFCLKTLDLPERRRHGSGFRAPFLNILVTINAAVASNRPAMLFTVCSIDSLAVLMERGPRELRVKILVSIPAARPLQKSEHRREYQRCFAKPAACPQS